MAQYITMPDGKRVSGETIMDAGPLGTMTLEQALAKGYVIDTASYRASKGQVLSVYSGAENDPAFSMLAREIVYYEEP